jgi:hypothetical protein
LENRVLLANQFLAAPDYPAGAGAEAVAIGEFTGDGRPDLITADTDAGTVSVLPGHGDGTFDAPINSPAGTSPGPMATGDFNKDGKTDLAVLDYSAGVLVLLGHGDGTFGAPTNANPGTHLKAIAVADLNGDGNADLVATDGGGNVVDISLGHGDGTFGAVTPFATPPGPAGVAEGDFNGDGKPDLVVAAGSAVGVLLGHGDGTFAAPITAAAQGPSSVAVGDFNGDGRLDVAVDMATNSGSLGVLMGNGDGTLRPVVAYSNGARAMNGLVAADLNDDGKPDLAGLSSAFGRGDANILFNRGDGTFGLAESYSVGRDPFSIAAGDLDGDGKADLVTANAETFNPAGSATVLLNRGGGQFAGARDFLSTGIVNGPVPVAAVTADFNGDGKPDVAVANATFDANSVGVLLGNGDGSFAPPVDYPTSPESMGIAAGDLNGDGKPDLVTADRGPRSTNDPGDVSVLLNRGDGTFAPAVAYAAGGRPVDVVIADFNGDGKPDLMTADMPFYSGVAGTLSLFPGNGDGTFGASITLPASGRPGRLAAADLNGDGKEDLVTTDDTNNVVAVYLGRGDGTFQTATTDAVGTSPEGVRIADLDGDGKLDVVTANSGSADVSVLRGDGDGTFRAAVNFAADVAPMDVAVADFNHDGHPDLVVADQGDGNSDTGDRVSLLRGDGTGAFGAPINFPVGDQPSAILAADFNGDGAPDTVSINTDGLGLTALINQDIPPPPSASIADASVVEGNGGTTAMTFTVTLSAPSTRTVTIDFATTDGTAVAGQDYVAASGTVRFAPGQTSRPITVNVLGDVLDEPDETFYVKLNNPAGATIAGSQATGTITDDDPPPSLSIADATVTEGNSGTTPASFVVSLSGPSGKTITVAYLTTSGTATAGTDFEGAGGTLTFAPGQTSQTITIPIIGDTSPEATETFSVALSAPSNATIARGQATGTIVDDDPPSPGPAPASLQWAASSYSADENQTSIAVTVTRTGNTADQVSIRVVTQGGDAAPGVQYVPVDQPLVFAAGETAKTVVIPILDDGTFDGDRSVDLVLRDPATGAVLGAQATVPLLIRNTDPPPAVRLSGVTTIADRHHRVNELVIKFSGAVSPGAATNLANYQLVAAGRRGSFDARKGAKAIKLRSAAYDAASESVTLTLARPFKLMKPVQLRVNSSAPSGLSDTLNRPIDGNGDGQPGGAAVAVLGRGGATLVRNAPNDTTRPAAGLVDDLLVGGGLNELVPPSSRKPR